MPLLVEVLPDRVALSWRWSLVARSIRLIWWEHHGRFQALDTSPRSCSPSIRRRRSVRSRKTAVFVAPRLFTAAAVRARAHGYADSEGLLWLVICRANSNWAPDASAASRRAGPISISRLRSAFETSRNFETVIEVFDPASGNSSPRKP